MAQNTSSKTDQPNTSKLFAIFPDYWKDKWGEKPVLGYVRADNAFVAERKAYDKGILRINFTIRPKAVEVSEKLPVTSRRTVRVRPKQ